MRKWSEGNRIKKIKFKSTGSGGKKPVEGE